MDQTGPRTNVPWRLCARIVAQLLVLLASVVCVCVCVCVCLCECMCIRSGHIVPIVGTKPLFK